MGHRLSKIYTRTGDDGTTGLGDGQRVPKDDLRIACIGTVDELNSLIGLIRASLPASKETATNPLDDELSRIQHELFDLGGELSIPGYYILKAEYVARLEKSIDAMNESLPMLKNFILPAGSLATAHTHLARAVCRRAERELATLAKRDDNLSAHAPIYLNRLSDWLFVAARAIARLGGGSEVLWSRQDQA